MPYGEMNFRSTRLTPENLLLIRFGGQQPELCCQQHPLKEVGRFRCSACQQLLKLCCSHPCLASTELPVQVMTGVLHSGVPAACLCSLQPIFLRISHIVRHPCALAIDEEAIHEPRLAVAGIGCFLHYDHSRVPVTAISRDTRVLITNAGIVGLTLELALASCNCLLQVDLVRRNPGRDAI